jgi:hypothetical protein
MTGFVFMVREYTRTIKGAPGHADHPDYWVYCSDEFTDYYEALKYAVDLEKQGRYKNWVECIMDCEFQ